MSHLKGWLNRGLGWLDTQFTTLPFVETSIPWSGIAKGSAGPLDTQPPTVVAFQRGDDGRKLNNLDKIAATFSEDVASSIDASDRVLTNPIQLHIPRPGTPRQGRWC